jgi:hypothetical protein
VPLEKAVNELLNTIRAKNHHQTPAAPQTYHTVIVVQQLQ